MSDTSVNLLWTSGWDSTYRMLELVLIQGRPVQPYYVFGQKRRSASIELETMEKIKQAIFAKSTGARSLIRETIVRDVNTIPVYEDITKSFERLKATSFIGSQYDLLPRMARYLNLVQLELCVHIDDRLYEHLKGNVQEVNNGYELVENLSNPDLEILRSFRFPILMLTKLDMERLAQQQGFADILEMSWFCYRPDSKGRPCGCCNPCRYTTQEGMGRRIPWQGHTRRTLVDLVARAKHIIKGVRRRLIKY